MSGSPHELGDMDQSASKRIRLGQNSTGEARDNQPLQGNPSEKPSIGSGATVTTAVSAEIQLKAGEVLQAAKAAAASSLKDSSPHQLDDGDGVSDIDIAAKLQAFAPNAQNPTLTVPSATSLPEDGGANRPPRGSDEWHRLRRLNHKEVERRRRDSINKSIKELQQLLPTHNSNKTQIIQTAAEYIRRLKKNEDANIEKWTLEKLITDQAVNELANSNEKLKSELEKAYREIEHWKKAFFDGQKELGGVKPENKQ